MKLKSTAGLLVALFAAGMAGAPSAIADGKARELNVHAKKYQQYFAAASAEFSVPAELLESIAYAETRWRHHMPKGQARKNGEPDVEVDPHGGMPPNYGIMGLRNDAHFGSSPAQAAGLIREQPAALLSSTRANIRGAAALLAHYGARKTRAFALEDWTQAVALYSGIPQPEIAQLYTYEVFAAIRQGREGGEYKIRQRHVDMEKIYGRDKLKKLAAPRITVETGVPDPTISAPGFQSK
ncbi:hypothetical protein HHL21_02215 [Massilia sp. RP-1-19]|uniref:Transglycosylase SLT domain-containing protein n=1 Tax=Massilia polaris TaxID=2728846 RepID=A0A848HDL9_9BURK|nr:hypothetical protein [Massilia polaris]NML59916.1 hypothetical protein [Massilia polaris]